AHQAADLCKQLLAYSGKGRFVIRRINLNELIEDMRQLLQVSISKKAALEVQAEERISAIEADPSQIRQVLLNLVINASEALEDPNGYLRLRTGLTRVEPVPRDEPSPLKELPAGEYVYVEVSDTGCGMDRETLGRIFDPFFTTKFIGRGLGLAAVSGIVRAHRGAWHITSEPGRGSTFRILFPSCGQESDPLALPMSSPTRWRGHGTVLVADDEEGVRAVTAQMLRSFGFDVRQACNGEEVIAILREQAESLTAIVLDLTMPRLSGEESLGIIHRLAPGLPVLLVSGCGDQELLRELCERAASDFLTQPFKLEELRAKMQAIVEPRVPERDHPERPARANDS